MQYYQNKIFTEQGGLTMERAVPHSWKFLIFICQTMLIPSEYNDF